ncbi:MAG: glutathione S-transferase family protein [Gammaproteobacteria bacterium]
MKLYTTPNSPYGRVARVVVIEKQLDSRVSVEPAATRQTDSPYYAINPSGRVPYLLLDDGTGLEDSRLICAYLDELDGSPTLRAPAGRRGLQDRRIEATASSLMDGLSVWAREYIYRAPALRSDFIIEHEKARAERLCGLFDGQIDNPVLNGPLNMAQIILACALQAPEGRPPGFEWRERHLRLSAWIGRIGERPSMASTMPLNSGH